MQARDYNGWTYSERSSEQTAKESFGIASVLVWEKFLAEWNVYPQAIAVVLSKAVWRRQQVGEENAIKVLVPTVSRAFQTYYPEYRHRFWLF